MSSIRETLRTIRHGAGLISLTEEFRARCGRFPSRDEVAVLNTDAVANADARFDDAQEIAGGSSRTVISTLLERMATQSAKIMPLLSDDTMPAPEKQERLNALHRDFCWCAAQSANFNAGAIYEQIQDVWTATCTIDGQPRFYFG